MKAKLENFWYYYKWYVLGGLLVLLLALNFILQKKEAPEPDCQIALVTVTEFDEDALAAIAARAEAELTGDGEDVPSVQVNYYPYDADAMAAQDTSRFMASSVQLAADIQYSVSCAYITDTPELLLEADESLYAPDGISAEALGLGAEYTVLCREETWETVKRIFMN